MKPSLPLLKRGGKKKSEKKRNAKRIKVDLQRTGLAVLTVVILSVLLSIHMLPSKVSLRLGDTSPEDIIAPKTARYKDTTETERRREMAAASVGGVYDVLPNAPDQGVGALKIVFHTIESVRDAHKNKPVSEKIEYTREKLGSQLGSRISDSTLSALLRLDSKTLREVEDDSLRIVSVVMSKEIHDDPASLRAARDIAMAEAARLLQDSKKARWVGEVARDSLRHNRIYNEDRTIALQDEAQDEVQSVHRLIMRGDTVISKGEQVLPEHIEKFEALGLRNPKVDFQSVTSLTMLVVVAVTLVLAYLSRYHPDVYASTKTLLLLALIVIVSTMALRVGGSMLGIKLSPTQVGYFGMLWVVTAGMLIAVLINPQVSVVITALLSLVLSLMVNNELRFAASTLITTLVGIYSVANIRDRNDLMRSVGLLAGVGVILVWIMGGISGDTVSMMVMGSAWAIGIALSATWLFWIGTALLERPFGKTTHISLLELADTNKPLLKRLLMEAPGTYTHSMLVGSLAESAAEAIGADSLVARVSAYYHDIGKLRRPHFFVENQHVENVHDRMNPTLSALVITSHVKDGVDIAHEFKLPKIVVDVINQHHGASLVQYFYSQIAGEQEPCTALEQQFRYPGPKPRTKEAAIVMLADAVEAASRCIVKPTQATIELLVNRIVADKLRDNQFDECDLTLKEVSSIADCLVRRLTANFHARIEYPELAASADGKRLAANADSDTKLTEDTGEDAEDQDTGSAAVAG